MTDWNTQPSSALQFQSESLGFQSNLGFINAADDGASPSRSASFNAGALQATLNRAIAQGVGEITIPPGIYQYDTGLVLAPASSQIHVNIRGIGGVGANGVTLRYTGSGGSALTIANNTRYQFQNLRIEDAGSGAIGLYLTSLTAGSNHGPATYTNVFVGGFSTNVQLGDTTNQAASEITFMNLEVSNGIEGLSIKGPNNATIFTTGIRCFALQATSCTTAVKVSGGRDDDAPALSVYGGSFSNNDLDFNFVTPGHYHISDLWSEHSTVGQFLVSGSPTATQNSPTVTHVVLEKIRTAYPSTPSNFVAQFNQPGHYTVRDCTLQTGSIVLGGFDGGGGARQSRLIIENNTLVTAAQRIQYRAGSNTTWDVRYTFNGTAAVEAQNQDPDRYYRINTNGTETDL